jgi:hypothetical protein
VSDAPRRLIITAALLSSRDVSADEKLVLGCFLGWPGFPHRRPNRSEVHKVLPFLDHDAISNAMHALGRRRICSWDWTRCKDGHRPRMAWLAARADPKRTRELIHVPVALLQRLKGKGSKRAALLLALYHGEQKRRGAVQIPDRAAAWQLGWDDAKAVERARAQLERAGCLTKLRAASGRHAAAVYAIEEALPEAPPNLDSETGFDPARTRSLRRVHLNDEATLIVFASEAEAHAAQARADEADEDTRAVLLGVAAHVGETRPRTPYVHAKELLDRFLPRRRESGEGVKKSVSNVGFPDGVTVGFPDGVTVGFPDGDIPLVPLESLEKATSAPADVRSDEQKPQSETRPDEDNALAGSSDNEKPATREGEQDQSDGLPRSRAALVSIFGERLPQPIRGELDHLRVVFDEKYGALDNQQLALVDATLDRTIRSSAASDQSTAARERYGPAILAIRRVKTGDDELHDQLKAVGANLAESPAAERTIDLEAELAELLAG